jgi:hypothetical protein
MNMTWGQLREQVRRSILRDDIVGQVPRWDDFELKDFCHFALKELAVHTAIATATSVPAASGTEFPMPSNLFDTLDKTGEVFFVANGSYTFLDPINFTAGLNRTSANGFWTRPDTTLHLTTALDGSGVLNIEYYAHYDPPYIDEDIVGIPEWMHTALCYLIGAHAMTAIGGRSSVIRQWNQRPDTGQPENNPLRKQQQWYLEMVTRELNKVNPQIRTMQRRSER